MFPARLGGPRHLFTVTTIGAFGAFPGASGTFNSVAFPTAKKVLYVPIRIPMPLLVTQLFTLNGATASGNIDVGLYTLDGTKLVSSGSTAQAGTTQKQLFNVTDFVLGRGTYYMAVSLDNTTGTITRVSIVNVFAIQAAGCLTETTGSFGLPATASFASYVDAMVPVAGLLAQSVM